MLAQSSSNFRLAYVLDYTNWRLWDDAFQTRCRRLGIWVYVDPNVENDDDNQVAKDKARDLIVSNISSGKANLIVGIADPRRCYEILKASAINIQSISIDLLEDKLTNLKFSGTSIQRAEAHFDEMLCLRNEILNAEKQFLIQNS